MTSRCSFQVSGATYKTKAKCLTLSRDKAVEEELCEGELSAKIKTIEGALQSTSSCPSMYLITAYGDPYKPGCPVQISNNRPGTAEFQSLNRLLGVTTHSFRVYTTLRPSCSYHLEYDESLTRLKAIVFHVRAPTNSRAVICILRVQVSDLRCVAFICCPRPEDLDQIRHVCEANQALLRANPLGLLSIIYDVRTLSWEMWITQIWLEVNQVECRTRSAPPGWSTRETAGQTFQQLTMDPAMLSLQPALQLKTYGLSPLEEISCTDKLLPRLYTTDTEINHGLNVMSFALRYAQFCLDAVAALDEARRSVGLPPQTPGARAMVEDRIRFTQSRCCALQDRFAEIKERHRSQINASFSLIAHRESKISLDVARLVAIDSRTMKTIGVLTLVFLPATLVTSLWQANVFHLDEDANWKVYSSTTVAVTAFVFLCWWVYMRFSQRPLYRFETAYVPAEEGDVV